MRFLRLKYFHSFVLFQGLFTAPVVAEIPRGELCDDIAAYRVVCSQEYEELITCSTPNCRALVIARQWLNSPNGQALVRAQFPLLKMICLREPELCRTDKGSDAAGNLCENKLSHLIGDACGNPGNPRHFDAIIAKYLRDFLIFTLNRNGLYRIR